MDEYYEFAAEALEGIEEDEDEAQRLPKRYIREEITPMKFYEETEFRRRYRFQKATVMHSILPLVNEALMKNSNRGLPLRPIIKLLIALRFYATGNFQTVSGDLRGYSQPSISRIIRDMSILLAQNLHSFVKFPPTEQEQRQNITAFYQYAAFPSVAGCIDCTHIPICSAGGDNAEIFRNRKGYFSLNVQVVAGPKLEIMNIVVRHPGSTHDSVIFNRSSARAVFEERSVRGLLLGDNGYACRPYLLTPLLEPAGQQEINYNRAHKRTRNLVERVFGILKRRFPCL